MEDQTYINNSGLIIIWPFLPRFFEVLEMTENGEFIDSETRNRAVYLLQNLVYNEIDFPEYELVLNKLMLGMPMEYPLTPINELTQAEKDLSKSLLHGLIQNWEKVGNSSPTGIQETFMQREGIIEMKEESYTLTVANKSYDILMQSIPWNISIIKLPWMEKSLQIAWL